MVNNKFNIPYGSKLKKNKPKITPDEIRAIREYLGLSQVDAGELLGGGPRAFTKYEAGTVTPAASVVSLLRLLEANPATIKTLGGRVPQSFLTGPFDLTCDHIMALKEREMPILLRKILSAEAQVNDLPAPRIHVASNIYTPDGGEDGRISWIGGPEQTLFLPSRLNQFQLKSGKLSPGAAAKDVVTKRRTVKDMVRSVINDGGHYIMLCSHPYNGKEITKREDRIRKALRDAGLIINDEQIQFRDADQIASWVNSHPSVAMWLKEQTQPGVIGPFRSWDHWADSYEYHSSPWVEDERLYGLSDRLQEVAVPRQVLRIVGLSGVGKSHLVLKALADTERKDTTCYRVNDLVMYAVESEGGTEPICKSVQTLVDTSVRAVVVVDNCIPETHRALASMVLRQDSRLSLVTIDNELPTGTLDGNTLKVEAAASSVTEGIINHISPNLSYEDRQRLERFSKGSPEVAIRVGKTWNESRPIAHSTDDDVVRAFVLGRDPRNLELLLNSAQLLAVFGLVEVDSPANDQLSELAELRSNLNPADLRAAVTQLVDRGVAQKRGRFVTIQPLSIATRLAEQQWKEWSRPTWDRVLSGDTSPRLKVLAARQLSLLNTIDISWEVVAHVCRYEGSFDGLEAISIHGHAEVLSKLAEINPEVVANQIERSLKDVENLVQVSIDVRRQLVWALEKVAFHTCSFEEGASLLLTIAAAEIGLDRVSTDSDIWHRSFDSNAVGKFKGLFPMRLGGTEADGVARLSFLDGAVNTGDPTRRVVVAEGLIAGCETSHFERILGAEAQGSRPALVSWCPATGGEASEYIKGCVRRLAKLALEEDNAGITAREGLADALSPLIVEGLIGGIDEVESVVRQVTAKIDYWPDALRRLSFVLIVHARKINAEVTERVRRLVHELQPKSIKFRIRSLADGIALNYQDSSELDINELYQRKVETIRKVISEALEQPEILKASLPRLCSGQTGMALEIGTAVAELADSPQEWLAPFIEVIEEAPEEERNYDLLSGFVIGLAKSHPNDMDMFKLRAVQTRELAPVFLRVSLHFGITVADIKMATSALQDGLLTPRHFELWSHGGRLAEVPALEVAQLFDTMLVLSNDGFMQAVHLIGMYAYGAPEKLGGLLTQVLKLAQNATKWQLMRDGVHCKYRFKWIMDCMLDKGRNNPDACATALALAKAVAKVERFQEGELIKPLLPRLLSGFPEIVWPLLGQIIVSDPQHALKLRYVLGDPYSFGAHDQPRNSEPSRGYFVRMVSCLP